MKEIVFAPDLIGAAFLDLKAREVLGRWRDGDFKVVLNRQLLLLHLKTLRDLGLPPGLLKRWTLWLTSPERARYLSDLEIENANVMKICEGIAKVKIVSSRIPAGASEQWISVSEFARQHG